MVVYETRNYVMDSFEFSYGRVLENVDVEYEAFGTPKYDDEGNIINVILFFRTFQGTYSFISSSREYVMENSDFPEEFYFISVHSLGIPGSCSPSSTGLNDDFPIYSCLDGVNFIRQFLSEKFNINKVLGLLGEGIGGFQALTWACEYPDEMEFIFILNSCAKLSGYKFILSKTFENIIEAADNECEDYGISMNKALVAINSLLFAHSASKKVFDKIDNYHLSSIFDDFMDECLFIDLYDFKFRNNCDSEYNVVDKLSNIKAKSMFIGTNKNYFDSDLDMAPFKEFVKDSIVLTYDDEREDYYFNQDDYVTIEPELISFISQFKK